MIHIFTSHWTVEQVKRWRQTSWLRRLFPCGSRLVPVERTCTKPWQERRNGALIRRQAATSGWHFYRRHRLCHSATCRHEQESWRDVWHQTIIRQAWEHSLSSIVFHIIALRHARSSISTCIANSVACAIDGARLDCCNSIIHEISDYNINQIQRVPNTLTLVVTGTKWGNKSLMCCRNFTDCRFQPGYKIAMITSKIRQTCRPEYLPVSIQPATCLRHLRFAASGLLRVPVTKSAPTNIAFRAYSYAANSYTYLLICSFHLHFYILTLGHSVK